METEAVSYSIHYFMLVMLCVLKVIDYREKVKFNIDLYIINKDLLYISEASYMY